MQASHARIFRIVKIQFGVASLESREFVKSYVNVILSAKNLREKVRNIPIWFCLFGAVHSKVHSFTALSPVLMRVYMRFVQISGCVVTASAIWINKIYQQQFFCSGETLHILRTNWKEYFSLSIVCWETRVIREYVNMEYETWVE